MRSAHATSLAVLALALAACTTVTRVKGPDGTDRWFAVSCGGGKYNCYEAAAEQCPRGYIVADSGGGAVATGNFVGYQGDMLIKCKAGGANGSREPSPAVQREQAQEQTVARTVPAKDYSQCNAVFQHIEDTADLWADWFHATPAEKPPGHSAFTRVCVGLDEDVQLCLGAQYATTHHDACLAKLQALPQASRADLDALFTKASP
jgi:hypothetical protein